MDTKSEIYNYSYPNEVEILILLPNYSVEELKVSRKSSIHEIKDLLFQEIKTKLYYKDDQTFKDQLSSYVFSGVNRDAEVEEYYDESQLLCNLNLIDLVFQCLERKGNNIESKLTSAINHCIGISLDELPKTNNDELFYSELLSARKYYLQIAKDEYDSLTRDKGNLIMFQFSADYNDFTTLSTRQILQSMDELYITTIISIENSSSEIVRKRVSLSKDATVGQVIFKILMVCREYRIQNPTEAEEQSRSFVLKIASYDSYLIEHNNKLIHYDYVQSCLYNDECPVLSLYSITKLLDAVCVDSFSLPTYYYRNLPEPNHRKHKLDNNNQSCFSFTVKCAQLISKDNSRVYVRAALFCGMNCILGTDAKTGEVNTDRPLWNQKLQFDIELINLPRNARLCIALVQKSDRQGNEIVLGWANINVFDYTGSLVHGLIDLSLYPTTDNSYFYPCGLPYSYQNQTNSVLSVEFANSRNSYYDEPPFSLLKESFPQDSIIPKIKRIANKDFLSEMSEQDLDFLRSNMELCRYVPDSLPKLARSIRWKNRSEVGSFYSLLTVWPLISLESSLQLLSGNYFDGKLRSFAVKNLGNIFTESDLNFYLLQLIQALKYESYLCNDLAAFLLKFALQNKSIGQKFFWYLKSEMHNNLVKIYFGVLLEAFCRGYWNFQSILLPQCKTIEILKDLNKLIKTYPEDKQLQFLKEKLQMDDIRRTCENIQCLLRPMERLGSLIVDNCDVKKSKKRPFFLEWENKVEFGETRPKYIFKHGDDLRQDMLTLQLFAIFDWIWKRQFQDMKLLPYGCLATDKDTGIIEAVKDAKTVMSIQRKNLSAAMQINSMALYRWIQRHNVSPEEQRKAIDTFTRSCAGYSVATFVLGIRDRHPDNIMVNKRGQLFHIDFGHILNNVKRKLGINRERVPFVLTEDFICVVADGCDKPLTSEKFADFMELCGKAYLVLRQHASLILTLFSLMIHSGMPELTNLQDLEYVRKTLSVESSDEDALKYFNRQFRSAYKGAWTTKSDWLLHFLHN